MGQEHCLRGGLLLGHCAVTPEDLSAGKGRVPHMWLWRVLFSKDLGAVHTRDERIK